jgi:hypothetical protein
VILDPFGLGFVEAPSFLEGKERMAFDKLRPDGIGTACQLPTTPTSFPTASAAG